MKSTPPVIGYLIPLFFLLAFGCREKESSQENPAVLSPNSEVGAIGNISLESYILSGDKILETDHSEDSIFEYFKKILEYPYYVKDKETARLWIDIANIAGVRAFRQNRIFQALNLFLDADEMGHKFEIHDPFSLSNLASLYTYNKYFEKAYDLSSNCVRSLEKDGLYDAASLLLGNLLTAAMGMGDEKKVDSCLQQLGRPPYDTLPQARFSLYRGQMYLAMQGKQYDSALFFIQKSLQYAPAFLDTTALYAAVYKDQAGLFRSMGLYDSALAYYAKSMTYNYARNDLDALQDIYAARIALLNRQGYQKEYEEAVAHYTAISQAIKEENRTTQQQNLDYIIHQRKQDREISELYYDTFYKAQIIKKQKGLLLSLTAAFCLSIALFIILYKNKQRKARMNRILYDKTRLLLTFEQSLHQKPDTSQIPVADSGKPESGIAKDPMRGNNAPDNKVPNVRRLDKTRTEQIIYEIERLLNEEECYTQEDFSLDKLAQRLGSNTSYVSRIVNDYFHKSFSVLLNDYRVRKSCLLMDDAGNNTYTLEYIAKLAGFGNRVTFTKRFKEQIGMTPSEYWRLAKKKEA